MRVRRFVVSASVVMAVVGAAPAAHSLTAIDPGDFTVTMDKPGAGTNSTMPVTTCTVGPQSMTMQAYLDNVVGNWNQPGSTPPAAACTMTRLTTFTNAQLSGTVTNKTVGNGGMAQTCDMTQRVDISFTLGVVVGGSSRSVQASGFANSMTGFQACAWAMTFADSRASRMTGTIEQTYGFSGNGAPVECPSQYTSMASQGTLYCLTVTSSAKVFVVGGSGAFADTGGEGQFTSSDVAPVIIPRTGGVQGAALRTQAPVIVLPVVVPGVDSAATANGLKLALLAGAKPTARLVSPPVSGGNRTLGVGPDGASPMTVKAAAAPGAKCSMTAKAGAKLKTLLPSVKDADGVIASSITAATIKAKLGVKSGSRVTINLACSVGKTTAKTSQSVGLGA